MDKIAIFAMGESGGNTIINYLKKNAGNNIEILNFTHEGIEEEVLEAKEKADDVIVVYDAVEGMNRPFAKAVVELHKAHINPILVITNGDYVLDTTEAEMVIAELVAQNDRNVQTWDLDYRTLYFSAEKGFARTADFKERGIDALYNKLYQ